MISYINRLNQITLTIKMTLEMIISRILFVECFIAKNRILIKLLFKLREEYCKGD